jgi:hypothetical protein
MSTLTTEFRGGNLEITDFTSGVKVLRKEALVAREFCGYLKRISNIAALSTLTHTHANQVDIHSCSA